MSERGTPDQTRSRLILLGLLALFLAPLLAAVLLNSRWVDWQPPAARNYGTLVEPVVALPETLRGRLPAPGHWTLLAVMRSCEARCAGDLDRFDRIDRALGRHGEELEPVLVTDEPPGADPGAVTLLAGTAAWVDFLDQRLAGPQAVYLVDPRGNVMMRFPARYDAGAVRRDLERLLKYSRFGS